MGVEVGVGMRSGEDTVISWEATGGRYAQHVLVVVGEGGNEVGLGAH